jgi:hypothetical protein
MYRILLMFLLLLSMSISCQNEITSIVFDEETEVNKDEIYVNPITPIDETKILFIGNSLTFYNDMPAMVEQMATDAGKNVIVEQATLAGVPLRNMVNSEMVIDKINSRAWDYVILQSDDITAFPDMYDIEINTLNTFSNYILSNSGSTEIIYKMVWGLRNGVTVLELNGQLVYYSYEAYMQKIYNGTLYIAHQTGVVISPVGWTWKEVRSKYPDVELFASDNAHPSYNGSYLTAAVHYASIFKESCEVNSYNGNLSASVALALRTEASSMVLDSLSLWNMHAATGIPDL